MSAPIDPATVVQNQLFPPGPEPADAITVYEGADPVTEFKPWRAWDLRGPLLKLCWDLLRFQLIESGKPVARTLPRGLRDTITHIWFTTEQNNQILRRLAKVGNVDHSDITGD